MRYYLDENLSYQIAVILRSRGIDAVSVHEADTRNQADEDLLTQAAQEGRCFVTRDRGDLLHWTLRFFSDQRPHCGVLIVPWTMPGSRFAAIADALAAYAGRHPNGMQPYTYDYVSVGREQD